MAHRRPRSTKALLPLAAARACACALVLGCAMQAAWAQAVPDEREARRAELQQARGALRAGLAQEEAACWRRFAVEDCLRRARASVRERDAALQREEQTIEDAQRRERAAQRRGQAALAQQDEAVDPGSAPAAVPAPAGFARQGEVSEPQARPLPAASSTRLRGDDARARRQEARARAAEQQRRQAVHAAQQQGRAQEQASRAEEARGRQQNRLEKARQRRAEVESQRAQDAAAGRTAPRPLAPPQ